MGRRVTEHATEVLPPGAHRTDEWYEARRQTVTASEIAAVMGLSSWVSPFDLWHLKASGQDSQPDSKQTRRGRRYESLIVEDFTEDHPEFVVVKAGLCVNRERPWQACTPDGLVHERGGFVEEHDDGTFSSDYEGEPVAGLEAKSAASRDEWGEEGTDEIPVEYRCQVLWQLDTLGLTTAFVPVVFGFEYREYVVTYDEVDVKLMRDAAAEFLDSLARDEAPPIDSHTATTRRLKRIHADLVDEQAEVPLTLLRQYQYARRLKKAATDRMRLAENRLRHHAGPAARLVVGLEDGTARSFSHTITDVAERTQTVRAHTRDQINYPRRDV